MNCVWLGYDTEGHEAGEGAVGADIYPQTWTDDLVHVREKQRGEEQVGPQGDLAGPFPPCPPSGMGNSSSALAVVQPRGWLPTSRACQVLSADHGPPHLANDSLHCEGFFHPLSLPDSPYSQDVLLKKSSTSQELH